MRLFPKAPTWNPLITVGGWTRFYSSADKSLARPDLTEKNNRKVAIFRPTRRSMLPRTPGWTDDILNCYWVACKS